MERMLCLVVLLVFIVQDLIQSLPIRKEGRIELSIVEEYDALTRSAGLLDRSHVGRLKLIGQDSLDLLDRLSTNDLMSLHVDHGIPTVLTSNKGRIIDLLFVFRESDSLLVLTAPENQRRVADWIKFYIFAEDVVIRDVTEEMAMLSVFGPKGATLLGQVSGADIACVKQYSSTRVSIAGVKTTIIRSDFGQVNSYDLIAAKQEVPKLWKELLDKGNSLEVKPVSLEVLDILRVEKGVPAYGKELSEEFNPLEANLLNCISFTKGCYVGQEVVARLNTYQKVQKKLVGLRWNSKSRLTPNSKILIEGKQIGFVTSVASSPRLDHGLGLGYVRSVHAEFGTVLSVSEGNEEILVEVLT